MYMYIYIYMYINIGHTGIFRILDNDTICQSQCVIVHRVSVYLSQGMTFTACYMYHSTNSMPAYTISHCIVIAMMC